MEAIFISISVLYSTLKPIVCITNKLIEEINNIKRINTALENTTKYFDTGNLRIKSRVSLLSSILIILVNGSDVTKKALKKCEQNICSAFMHYKPGGHHCINYR